MNYTSIKNRAEKAVAQGCLTNSKHWNSHVYGIYPTHIRASQGCHLIDLNNKKYVDFMCGLGTNLLGYGHPLVEKEVEVYRHQGKSPSLPHILEVELAEELKQLFPWVERWKFLKSGSEACSAAIRIARAYTGSTKTHNEQSFYSEGYHGWHDSFVSLTPPAKGVLPNTNLMAYKHTNHSGIDSEDYSYNFPKENTSCHILEPVELDDSPERIKYLKELRKHCDKYDQLLIFDEVITGLRYQQYSVSKAHTVKPDLIVIGKAMANGYPLAAVGGPAKIMDNDYFVSSTYAGEIGSLAASKAVVKLVRENPNYYIDHLWKEGNRFIEEFNNYAKPFRFKIKGYATRGVFIGNPRMIAIFFQEACKAGILFGKSWFISFAHLQNLNHTLSSIKDIFIKMGHHLPRLEGQEPKSPFSMTVRKGS